jgi:hypothetical protein
MRRAARFGDAWAPNFVTRAELPEKLDFIRSQPGFKDRPRKFDVVMPLFEAEMDMRHNIIAPPRISDNRGEILEAVGRLKDAGATGTTVTLNPTRTLDEYLRGLDPSRLARLDEDVRTELTHVFPSLSALATARPVALQHERYRTHRAVRALLEHLAETRPLVTRARRPPLGRLGVRRAARRAAAAAAGHSGAHGTGAPPPPNAGPSLSRARAGASCGGADPHRAPRSDAR